MLTFEGVVIGDKLSKNGCQHVNSSNNGILIDDVPLEPLSNSTSCKGDIVECQ